jgi:hypothetical protein
MSMMVGKLWTEQQNARLAKKERFSRKGDAFSRARQRNVVGAVNYCNVMLEFLSGRATWWFGAKKTGLAAAVASDASSRRGRWKVGPRHLKKYNGSELITTTLQKRARSSREKSRV